jgi:hypothetical protein
MCPEGLGVLIAAFKGLFYYDYSFMRSKYLEGTDFGNSRSPSPLATTSSARSSSSPLPPSCSHLTLDDSRFPIESDSIELDIGFGSERRSTRRQS